MPIAADAEGSVYVAGSSDHPYPSRIGESSGSSAILLKFDSSGNRLWKHQYPKTNGRLEGSLFTKLLLAESGQIFVGGFSVFSHKPTTTGSESSLGFLLACFDQTTPRLEMGGLVAAGVRQGCLVSPRGSAFEIQATTDFQLWQPVDTVTNLNGLAPFYDRDNAAFPHRCYRALRLGSP